MIAAMKQIAGDSLNFLPKYYVLAAIGYQNKRSSLHFEIIKKVTLFMLCHNKTKKLTIA